MYPFRYRRPPTVAEAVAALRVAADGKLLAGGMTLIPAMQQRLARPSELIDLADIAELGGIRRTGEAIEIGAMTTHDTVAGSPAVLGLIPALAALAGSIGDPQVRNRGTIGGSLANNDPRADYPAAVLALAATIETDRRSIAADDFLAGPFATALAADELITAVRFPVPERAAYAKLEQPASGYALVGVFVARSGGRVRVAVTGAAPAALRLHDLEQRLGTDFSPEAVDGAAVPAEGLCADVHASAAYRAHLVTVLAGRAVVAALS
jgi:carbon-monoxide dehydrogenase medium subunit